METATVETRPATGAGSATIADLLPAAAQRYGSEAGGDVSGRLRWSGRPGASPRSAIGAQLSLGLIDLGVQKGDKVAILANTRPEWTYYDFAALTAGATVVPIYQTNSPEECQYVLENSDAKVVIVEDSEQLEKIRQVRDRCPKLEHVILMTGSSDDAISAEELVERGASHEASEWEERWRSVGPDDICTFIYTSGTTGPPKGCVISHGNYRAMLNMALEQSVLEPGRITYLYLPLAHSFALLIQLLSFDVGGVLAYWERDPLKILPNLAEVKPHYFPSVPRIFEKIYTAANSKADKAGGAQTRDLQLGGGRRPAGPRARAPGQEPVASASHPARDRRPPGPVEHPQPVRRADHRGGLRRRPDQPRDPPLLRRRRRSGAGGLGNDGDLHRRDDREAGRVQVRHDRQAVPGLRGEDRRRRRDPGARPQRLPGLLQERGGDPRDPGRRLAAHRRHRRRSTPTATSRSPAARRTSSSPPGARTSPPRTSRPR